MSTGRASREREGRDGVMCHQAKEYQRWLVNPQKLGRRHGKDSPSHTSEGTHAANGLLLNFTASRPVRCSISIVAVTQFVVLC